MIKINALSMSVVAAMAVVSVISILSVSLYRAKTENHTRSAIYCTDPGKILNINKGDISCQ